MLLFRVLLKSEKLGALSSCLQAVAEQQLPPSDKVCALQPALSTRMLSQTPVALLHPKVDALHSSVWILHALR